MDIFVMGWDGWVVGEYCIGNGRHWQKVANLCFICIAGILFLISWCSFLSAPRAWVGRAWVGRAWVEPDTLKLENEYTGKCILCYSCIHLVGLVSLYVIIACCDCQTNNTKHFKCGGRHLWSCKTVMDASCCIQMNSNFMPDLFFLHPPPPQ